ncbi:MAG TPA: 30S ribosomal protein S16 [Nocardioides sp.]|uniref:30S ribosomal protein S16 n=1 Tax=Nocardioides sp. TaxID=35761 RepID=UPI002E363C8A|nr:30S ribosomal protein S16 [Nocardioides sp.]HEX3931413.1 30S ribosomal protein S16 [Nocardioides sp.]
MAVKIRLKRMGKVRAPHYRIVVVDSRKKRDGRVLEEIGLYHPKEEPSFIRVESERAQYWLGVGAQPSEAVAQILKITGDWQRFKGYKNTEGTLRVAEPKRDKLEIFNEALKDSAGEPRGEAVTKRTAKKAAEKPAEKAAEAKAEEPAVEAPAVEEPAAVEAPAVEEAAAEAPVAEEAVPVPADETPQGAADVAETAETAEVDADAKSDEG